MPEVIFFPAGNVGTPLHVVSGREEFPYSFKNDGKLATAMEEALEQAATIAAEKKVIKDAILALYKEHNPAKISSVEKLWNKYAGKEEELLKLIRKKYGVKQDL